MVFREYIKDKFKNKKIIEFGPLTRPLFKKSENKEIYYADIRSTEEIKSLYKNNDYLTKTGIKVDVDSIVSIDYKIEESYAKTFKNEKFQVAYLSHVIEHMPNIIDFFQDISKVLTKDGRLVIIYPDKRYCFDHYRNSVSFRDAFATFKNGTTENARLSFDFSYNVVHENNPIFFWDTVNKTNIISNNTLEDAEKYYYGTLKSEDLEDVHYWPFSDFSFLKFFYEFMRSGLTDFEIEEFYPTQQNTQEFMIILKKSSQKNYDLILRLLDEYDPENIILKQKNKINTLNEEIENITKETLVKEKNTNDLIQSLKLELNNINNSKSMKITAPLRKITKMFKKYEK